MKAVNNMMSLVNLAAACEAMLVRGIYRIALESLSEQDDITAVVQHMERAAGVELRAVADDA